MLHRCLVAAIAIAALQLAANDARAYDDALYPNLKGQWHRTTAPRYDPNDLFRAENHPIPCSAAAG